MSWFDDLKNGIESVITGKVFEDTSQEYVQGLLNDLYNAIVNSLSTISSVFILINPFFSAFELGKLLLMKAVQSGNAGHVEKCINFAKQKNLLTNLQIINLVFVSLDFAAVPQNNKKIVLEVLSNRVLNLDDLLAAIDKLGLGLSILPLLVEINYSGGQDELFTKILKYTSRFPALFAIVLPLIIAKGMSIENIIIKVMDFSKTYRDRVIDVLLPLLPGLGLFDPASLIKNVYEFNKSKLDYFIKKLFQFNILQWDFDSLKGLLSIPLSILAGEIDKAKDLFMLLLGVLLNMAKELGSAASLMEPIVDWIAEGFGSGIRWVENEISPGYLQDSVVTHVSTPVWLVASAFEKFSGGSSRINFNAVLPLFAPFVAILLELEDKAKQQCIIAEFLRFSFMRIIMIPFLILKATTIPMKVFQWIGQDVRHITQDDRALRIKELTVPSATKKYMIFSDLHRDSRMDVQDSILFDVSHFKKNKDIYKTALNYCLNNGYTVIENGDCEELWYAPDVRQQDAGVRAADILSYHSDVYALLKQLYNNGRYYRTTGNHDDYWTKDTNINLLRSIFDTNFTVWDGIVIPGVKTMSSEIFKLIINTATNWNDLSKEDFYESVITQIPFGLSPDRYTEKLPLLIMHGHQFDFWNCEEHSFLGKAITQGIAVPADGLDALPYYLKGIDWDGNPVFKFGDVLARITPWDSWPPEDFSVARARQIENMDELDRKLNDDYMFCESFAASMSVLLRYGEISGINFPPYVQILIGHTHYPQSRPHLNLGSFIPGAGFVDKMVKAPYYNSGGGGWWEGVVWAIEITEKGQPKLVYWDRCGNAPRGMSWELHDNEIPWENHLAALEEYCGKLGREVSDLIDDITDTLRSYLNNTATLSDIIENLQDTGNTLALNLSSLTGKAADSVLNTLSMAVMGHNSYQGLKFNLNIDFDNLPVFSKATPVAGKLLSSDKLFKLAKSWLSYFENIADEIMGEDTMLNAVSSLFYSLSFFSGNELLGKIGQLVAAAVHYDGIDLDIDFNSEQNTLELSFEIH